MGVRRKKEDVGERVGRESTTRLVLMQQIDPHWFTTWKAWRGQQPERAGEMRRVLTLGAGRGQD
jgi:hypothetical protein